MTSEKLLEEFQKCKEDPIHFMCNYIKVAHPVRGLVNFDLYPFQKDILNALENNRFNILRKFRQAGCTTIASAYALWMAIFQKYKSIVILSKGDAESTEVLDRIKLMHEELPNFLRPKVVEDNKHTLKLSTNSIIKSRPSGKQSGRSLAGSLLIIDEAAFIDNIDSIWAAVYPIISTGGRAFVLSTVNGVGNWYHEIYTGAINGENSFNAIDIEWKDHPEYKRRLGFESIYKVLEDKGLNVDKWEETTKANMPLRQWLQEYECEFLGTGQTYIDGGILRDISEKLSEDYYNKYNNRMRVWKDPFPAYDYVIGVDVALGRQRDYSAFHIINMYNGEQVAEFYSNKTPINEFAEILAREANLYNTSYLLVERNTIGNNLIDWLHNILEYENLWADEKGDIGFQVTAKNREVLLASLEESIRTDVIKINSKRTVKELFTFVITDNGKAQADAGNNDDLVTSLSLSVFGLNNLRETTPIEYSKIPHKEQKPLIPTVNNKAKLTTAFGSTTEEDIKWLMK
jgi:hypothetical protein